MIRWHNPSSGWQREHDDRIAREERMLAERRAREQHERECAPPGPHEPITSSFLADGRVITPQGMRVDDSGGFITVLVDGRVCCLGTESGTDERTGHPVEREVLMLVEPNADGNCDEAPDCPAALRWCEFEYAVRTKDGLALAVYGLMRAALALRAGSDAERAKQAMSEADTVFGELGAGEQ